MSPAYNLCLVAPPLAPSFPSYDTTSGHHERQSPQPNYTTYSARPSSPPVLSQTEQRRLPPPLSSSPGGERWQQSGNYGMPAVHGYHASQAASLRSPSANYPNTYMTYPGSNQGGAYTYLPTYDQLPLGQQDQASVFEDLDSVHMQHHHHQTQQRPISPYSSRVGSSQTHPSPPPISPTTAEEPSIKKKRKRADAHQLKVLNETYARTAFPSTEERHALAKALDMSPRSVQIWCVIRFPSRNLFSSD
jgi:homeobox protein YOX1/YHP1